MVTSRRYHSWECASSYRRSQGSDKNGRHFVGQLGEDVFDKSGVGVRLVFFNDVWVLCDNDDFLQVPYRAGGWELHDNRAFRSEEKLYGCSFGSSNFLS